MPMVKSADMAWLVTENSGILVVEPFNSLFSLDDELNIPQSAISHVYLQGAQVRTLCRQNER